MNTQETQARQRDTRDIVWGAMINLAGAAIRSLRLLLLVILGRLYGAEGLGLYLLAYATLDTFNKLVVMGLDQAVLTHAARRYAAEDLDGMYATIGQALVMSLAAAARSVKDAHPVGCAGLGRARVEKCSACGRATPARYADATRLTEAWSLADPPHGRAPGPQP